MHSIFGLIEDGRLRRFHHCVRHFLSTLRGEAVKKDCVGPRFSHQRFVHLIRAENLAAHIRFVFLTHRGPDVCVDDVRVANGFRRVMCNFDGRAHLFRRGCDLLFRFVAGRTSDGKVDAEAAGGDHQRMGDIVSVTGKGEIQTLQIAESLTHREHVRERLAWVPQIAQRVHHRDPRPAREFVDGVLRVHARDDGVGPSLEVARHILERFAVADGLHA